MDPEVFLEEPEPNGEFEQNRTPRVRPDFSVFLEPIDKLAGPFSSIRKPREMVPQELAEVCAYSSDAEDVGGPSQCKKRMMGPKKTKDLVQISKGAESGKGINDLPNELLVDILGRLSAKDLLLRARLVCKRWKDVAEDDKTWQTVDLAYNTLQPEHFIQIIQRAPTLRSVSYVKLESPTCAVADAMLKGCKNIKSLTTLPIRDASLWLDVLAHYKDSLEILNVYMTEDLTESQEEQYSAMNSMFQIIGGMTKLKSLKLWGAIHYTRYTDVLITGCPRLKDLNVRFLSLVNDDGWTGVGFVWLSFVKDLILSKKDTLRKITLPDKMDVIVEDLLKDGFLNECIIEKATIPLGSLQLIQHMPHLKSLTVYHSSLPRDSLSSTWLSKREWMEKHSWIKYSPVVSSLKHLTIETTDLVENHLVALMMPYCTQLETFAAKECTDFFPFRGVLSTLIKTLPTLKELTLYNVCTLEMDHIKMIPKYMPNLRRLDLRSKPTLRQLDVRSKPTHRRSKKKDETQKLIKFINKSILQEMPKLNFLHGDYIEEEQIQCSCSLRYARLWDLFGH